jgi:putative cardiolipin synthase
MNFDQRSLDIKTEIGVIIHSPQLAREIAARFEAIVQPANSYKLGLEMTAAGTTTIQWVSEVGGRQMRWDTDPDVDAGRRTLIQMLSVLPLETKL